MNYYEVGKQVCAPSGDSIQFDMADDGATLLIKIQRPTPREKKSFKDRIPFRFVVVEDIIFVLIRLDGTWMDMPYYKYLSRDLTRLPDPSELSDDQGIAIHALLVDASTGVLIAQKLFSPDNTTSRKLVEAIRKQPMIDNYTARLQRLYQKYTTLDLLKLSQEGHS